MMHKKMSSALKYYLLIILLLILLFSLMIAWEVLRLGNSCHSDLNVGCSNPVQQTASAKPSYIHHSIRTDEETNITIMLLEKFFRITDRPPLVRFDWYSQKRTPVHIG